MEILNDNFSKIKNALSLETYAQAKLIRAHAGNTFICPNCKSGGKASKNSDSAFSIKGNRFHCFSCNKHGDIFDLIGLCENISDKNEQLKAAAKFANISLDYSNDANAATITTTSNFTPSPLKENKTATLIQNEQYFKQAQVNEEKKLKQWQNDLQNHANAIQYLNKRGYDLKQAQALKIGFNSETQMLVLPFKGSNYYHVDRAINDTSKMKHFKPKNDILGAQPLYNPNAIKQDVCIVVEGVFDALALESLGFNNVIALGGCNNQTLFLKAIKTAAKKPYTIIFFDNDSSGAKASSALKIQLESICAECKEITNKELNNVNLKGKDPDEIRRYSLEALKSFLTDVLEQCREEHRENEKQRYKDVLSAFNIIDINEKLVQLCSKDYERKTIATGFKSLDYVLGGGLPVGLTIIGALSSLGKTTLCLQMADYIAQTKRPVLFVTIEQSSEELLSKSLSRLTYALKGENLTGYDILQRSRKQYSNVKWNALYTAMNSYSKEIAPYMNFMEGKQQPSVQVITKAAHVIASNESETPVIFIDYLQLLSGMNSNSTDKQNTDNNVSALRQLARELNIPIVLISSLNRANYNSPVTLESYKESGSIEYSSDVLLGLQPASFSALDTTNEKTIKKDAKEKIKEHKEQCERELELVVLKNRNGRVPKDGIHLHFSARYNVWHESKSHDDVIAL